MKTLNDIELHDTTFRGYANGELFQQNKTPLYLEDYLKDNKLLDLL
jgi:hypothetical protein